jgi:serine/threonine-protein phosphatase 2A regulatory subunit B
MYVEVEKRILKIIIFESQVWDLNMESRPVETYHVHDYLRSKLCTLYENDSIFDKFECCWSGDDRFIPFADMSLRRCKLDYIFYISRHIITGSYNNFFRTFKRNTQIESTYEASLELCKPFRPTAVIGTRGNLASKKGANPATTTIPGKKRKEEISADFLDFNKKVRLSFLNYSVYCKFLVFV